MSEYGDFDAGQEHASLEAVHEDQGAELDHQSQYGILEQDHHSVEHEEFEQLKHIEYTDAAGNHYEVTEYTHYEHTEIEDEHTFAAYGSESDGQAGFGEADHASEGLHAGVIESGHQSFGVESLSSGLESITARFEDFLGSGFGHDNEINDASA
ncbi:hypothetical protein [Dactylosporangium sp. CA-092794]|uniref:hypothetical protein n=1 Tax=Dactylosporangium sp. CA-092794 TaxID=3239929 RepID=UPI003D9058EC